MFNKRILGIVLSLSVFFTFSCYNDTNPGSLLALLGGKTATTGDTGTGGTGSDTGGTGSDTGTGGTGDTGGTTVPAAKLSMDDCKKILNQILTDIDVGALLQTIKDGCTDGTRNIVDKDTIKIDAKETCSPLSVVLTVTLKQYTVEGIDCALSGVMTINVQFPVETQGEYLLTINTAEGAPITTQGDGCGNSAISISDLSMYVKVLPFSTQFSGTVVIGGESHTISEFITPADILEMLKGAFDDIPWDKIISWFNSAGGGSSSTSPSLSVSSSALQSSAGTTYTVYNKDGLKVGLGLSKDWEIIIDLTFTGYKVSATSSYALNGTMSILASFESWDVLKLVCNTETGAPLTISGLPLITPKIGLTDVTIYYDWYNEAIVDNGGNSGTISLNGIKFGFDPSWITKIMGMLQ